MKKMNTTLRVVTLAAAATASFASQAQTSPYLPIPGQFALSVGYVSQSGDNAYIGDQKIALKDITMGGASDYKRSGATLRLDYGFSDALALDATLANSKVEVGGADNDSGNADSVLGLRWRVTDEFEGGGWPTITLRGAAIIKGNYEGARLASIGKGASGFEIGAVVGKHLAPGLAVWGEVSSQSRDNDVPSALSVSLSGKYSFAPQWSVGLGLTNKKFDGNLDIGGAGFTPAKFQQVREERSTVNLNLGYAFASNQGVSLSFGKLTSGRNTVADDQIIGLNYTFAFN